MTFRENLSEYEVRSSTLIEESPQMDEQNTKRKVIEPLIEILDWDILSSDVELEYSVQMGSGTKKVDYALKTDGTPVVFVEAKGCDTDLAEKHRRQLKSYMRQVGVDWGLLSNGREFEIFKRDSNSNRPNEISLAHFSLNEAEKNRHPLSALSKTSIDTGESIRIAKRLESVQNAVRELREQKDSVAEDITRVVTEVAGESVSQIVESEAKNFVDRLVASLEEQAHRSDSGKSTNQPMVSRGKSRTGEETGYTISIRRGSSQQRAISQPTQNEAMTSFVNYLIREQDLLSKIDLPYVPGTGRGSSALINDSPVHTNGNRMRSHEKLSGGCYLYTSLNSESKRRYMLELAEKTGLECVFGDNW